MEKLSIQSLNALFSYLDQHPTTVLWVRTKDYKQQVYLGSNFERIWKRPTELIYKSPDLWEHYLYEEDKNSALQKIHGRIIEPERVSGKLFFRIVDAEGNVKFIKDEAFMLTDDHDRYSGLIGFGQLITEREWHSYISPNKKHQEINYQQQKLKEDVFKLLKQELKVEVTPQSSQRVPPTIFTSVEHWHDKIRLKKDTLMLQITSREMECLAYLAAGKTAKQTAQALKISPRTVVFHLDNIRRKTKSQSKMELLSKLIAQ
jgi:LuxR family transcriptional regulator of spore coat protein